LDERAGRAAYDSQKSASNENDLRGKILRIHPQPDGTYTIPSGNMFHRAREHTARNLRDGLPQSIPFLG